MRQLSSAGYQSTASGFLPLQDKPAPGAEPTETTATVMKMEAEASLPSIPYYARKNCEVCPFQNFDSYTVRKEKAEKNMKAFINHHTNPKAPELPFPPWLSTQQRTRLLRAKHGRELLHLINDTYQLAQACAQVELPYFYSPFVLSETLPFDFTTAPRQLMSAIDKFFDLTSRYHCQYNLAYMSAPIPLLEHHSVANVLQYQRLQLKLVTSYLKRKQQTRLAYDLFMADFTRTVQWKRSHALVNLAPPAFELWLTLLASQCEQLENQGLKKFTTQDFLEQLNQYSWSLFDHGLLSDEHITTICSHIPDFVISVLLPGQILPYIFRNPVTQACCSQPVAGCSRDSNPFPQPIDPEAYTFGEEFEYRNQENTYFTRSEADSVLRQWASYLWSTLTTQKITDYSINPEVCEKKLSALSIRIGKWHCRVYRDADSLLEVNTSPYHLHQTFVLKKEPVPVATLFDDYIIAIARALKLTPNSGHKHIGIKQAFHGNAEVLLRLLLDIEARPWLPCLYRRADSAYYFAYISQRKEPSWPVLPALVNAFNQQLITSPARACNNNYSTLVQLVNTLHNLELWNEKYVPLNLKNLKHESCITHNPLRETYVRKATTTIEFRVPQAARTGQEAMRLNQMLIAWIQLMEQHQRQNKPLVLNRGYPPSYQDQDELVTRLYHDFIHELGLDWEEFKSCSFIC